MSASALSVRLQHVSDAQGRERRGEKGSDWRGAWLGSKGDRVVVVVVGGADMEVTRGRAVILWAIKRSELILD